MSQSPTNVLDVLRRDNKVLTVKLRYLQSISTFYRQRVTALVMETMRRLGLSSSAVTELDHVLRQTADQSCDAVRFLTAIDDTNDSSAASPSPRPEVQSFRGNSNAETGGSEDPIITEADFWKQQFLNLLAEMRPASAKEAETLLETLQDKRQLQLEVISLKAQLASQQNEGNATALVHQRNTVAPALDASLSNTDQALAGRATPDLFSSDGGIRYPNMTPQTLEDTQRTLREEQHRCRLLKAKVTKLQRQMVEQEAAHRESARAAHSEMIRLASMCATLRNERQGLLDKINSTTQELHAAELSNGEFNIREERLKDQIKVLNQQIELASRNRKAQELREWEERAGDAVAMKVASFDRDKTKQIIAQLKADIEVKNKQLYDSDLEIMKARSQCQLLERIVEQQRLEFQSAFSSKSFANDSLETLHQRLRSVCEELQGRASLLGLKECIESFSRRIDATFLSRNTADALSQALEKRHEEIVALRAECDRAVSLGIPPSIGANVDAPAASSAVPAPRHRMLRQSGPWMEIRDTATSSIIYVTTDVTFTPFYPTFVEPKQPPPPSGLIIIPLRGSLAAPGNPADPKAFESLLSSPLATPRAIPTGDSSPNTSPILGRQDINLDSPAPANPSVVGPAQLSAKLRRLFELRCPERIGEIDGLVERFADQPHELLSLMERRYGPVPPIQLEESTKSESLQLMIPGRGSGLSDSLGLTGGKRPVLIDLGTPQPELSHSLAPAIEDELDDSLVVIPRRTIDHEDI